MTWKEEEEWGNIVLSHLFLFLFFQKRDRCKKKMMDVFKTSQILGIINFIHQIS